jgi:hypothetical protein
MPRRKIGAKPLTNAEKSKRFRLKRNAVAKFAEETLPLPYKLDADDVAEGKLDPDRLDVELRVRQLLAIDRKWSPEFVADVAHWAENRKPGKRRRRKTQEAATDLTLQPFDLKLQSYDLELEPFDLKLADFGDVKLTQRPAPTPMR